LWSFRWITFSGAGLAVGVVLSALTGTLEDILEHGGGWQLLPALPSWWAAMSLLLGTSLSVAQWLALRGRVARAWLWALVSGVAWLASVPVGWIGSFIAFPVAMLLGAVIGNAGGIVGGLVMPLVWVLTTGGLVGSATGLLLMALLRGRPERPSRVR
jgi:hypothetical protein